MLQNSEGSRSLPEKSAGMAFPRVPAPLHHRSSGMNKIWYTAYKADRRTLDKIQAPQSTSREASVERAAIVVYL